MIPSTLTPQQADLYVVGLIVAHVQEAIAAGREHFNVAQATAQTLKLRKLGNGIDKTAYALPSGAYVVKVSHSRNQRQNLTQEQKAMDLCRAKGLPVPEQHLLHECVALAECCPALCSLDFPTRQRIEAERVRVVKLFQAVGMGDQHDGNFGLRADGTVVAIDIGFGLKEVTPEPVPEPVCDCTDCKRWRQESDERRAAEAVQAAADRAEREAERVRVLRERIARNEAAAQARRDARRAIMDAAQAAVQCISGLEDTRV